MYVKRLFRRYRGEIRVISSLLVISLLFGIYNLLHSQFSKEVEGSTLSSNITALPTSLPTYTPYPSLLVPTNIQINIYINNTSPIYNQIYNAVLTQMPIINPSPTPTSLPGLTQTPTSIPNPTSTPVPTATPTPTPTPTTAPLLSSFTAKYFNNLDLSGSPILNRTDSNIDFDWGFNAPASGLNIDRFSVQWIGTINAAESSYRITTRHDDGMRIYIDNTLIYNNWSSQSATTRYNNINLSSGSHTIKIEYYESGGGANAYFTIQKL